MDGLRGLLRQLAAEGDVVALHNDGAGTDQLFAQLARDMRLRVEITPHELSPMPRNRELVRQADVLIGVPPTDCVMSKGSGTWETIKYMWKAHKTCWVVLSDGTLTNSRQALPTCPKGPAP